MGSWDSFLNWLRSWIFKREMELCIIGLQNAGKTSLVSAIAIGGYNEDRIPTIGLNMQKITKGYVVDAADRDSILISNTELHNLLMKPSLCGIPTPLLVLGNKIDKSEALSLVNLLGLGHIKDREVCCYMISCKNTTNIDVVVGWLIKHSKIAKESPFWLLT